MRIPGIVLIAGLASATAQAADPNGKFQIVGAGALACQKYLGATEQQRAYTETWWAGYMTAMNRSTGDTHHLMGDVDPAEVNAMILRDCTARPNESIGIVVRAVMEQLYPKRRRAAPK